MRRYNSILICFLLCISNFLAGQIIYPVSISSNLQSSGSVYLSDYYDDALNLLSTTLTFQDFNEAQWDVKLRLKIESSSVLIQNKINGVYTPITLYPGQPEQLSGSLLSEYFSYSNLESQGISMSQLQQDGRLPEGTYTFSWEVLDYNSGRAISLPSFNLTYVVLYDPPLIQSPQNEVTIQPQNPQNIIFQWQDGTPPTYGNSQSSEFILKLYEVVNNQIDPKVALQNNQVIEIYTSLSQTSTLFSYNSSYPILDPHKRYIFVVQAVDVNGRDVFKNDGISEPHWFSYGYSVGGSISLVKPQEDGAFTKNEAKLFEWTYPSNLASGQSYYYEYRITKITGNQTPEQAILNNTPLHVETTNEISSQGGWSYLLQEELESGEYYAWQVKAYTSQTEIAASAVQKIKGPPFLESFIAGSHEVIVRQSYNEDLNNFKGNGDVKISENGDVINIDFDGLKISKSGNRYVLDAGEIVSKINNLEIELNPDYTQNGKAFFKADSLKLDKNRLAISGKVEWDFPLATTSSTIEKVISKNTWFNYDSYTLSGESTLPSGTRFSLADPINFKLHLNTASNFLIHKNDFILRFKGQVELPSSINALNDNPIQIPFNTTEQLFYFQNNSCQMANHIKPIDNVKIIAPFNKVRFDFSDDQSPGKFELTGTWKGVYVHDFDVLYYEDMDTSQVQFKNSRSYQFNTTSAHEYWITSQGLHLNFDYNFPNSDLLTFNTFGGIAKGIHLEIDQNQINNSHFEGGIEILILSTSQLYDFHIPITEQGFQEGSFKTPLDGEEFDINTSIENLKITATITRAVFMNNSFLDMTIDVDWPAQNIQLSNITDFRVWGNSNIGFINPNSMIPLQSQYITKMGGGHEITVDSIGAGLMYGSYSFVFASSISLGDDISGKNGPPRLTLQSNEPKDTRSKSPMTPGMSNDPSESEDENTKGGDKAGNTSSISDLLKTGLEFGLTSDEPGVVAYPYIKINAVLAKFEGHLSLFEGHEEWGTGFHGYLYGKILIPIAKEAYGHIIIGNFQDETYWFVGFSAQIGERANQIGSKFLTKMPDGSGRTLKSKRLGKLSGANTLKVGVPLGPISLTGFEGRLYHHMNHTIPNTVLGENGFQEFDYQPDLTTDYGFLISASFIDTKTQGTIAMFTGSVEAAWQEGGKCRSIGIQAYSGFGNLFLPGGFINASILEGEATITWDHIDKHFIGESEVSTGLPTFCGGGTLDMNIKPGSFNVDLGSPNDPVHFVPGCIGYSLAGWMELSQDGIFLGAGIRAQMELQSPWIGLGEIAAIRPYIGFYLQAGIHTALSWNPEFQINDVGMWVEASAGVYCEYILMGDEGEWTLGKVSMAGNFNLHIQPTPVVVSGTLRGSVELLSIEADFEVSGSYEF